MSAVEHLTDEEIASALADADLSGPTMDPTEAMREASRRMKRIRDVLARKAVVDASAKEQHGEIDAWHTQETERFEGELTRLKLELEPYVSLLVASEPMGRKSVNLVAGRAGFREGRERVIVEDQEAAVAHLERRCGFECVRTTKVVDIPSLKRQHPQLDAIDGIRVERGERQFFAEPISEPTR